MNSIIVIILSSLGVVVGYFVYARRINRKIVQPDPKKATPAKMYMDVADFTLANRNVLDCRRVHGQAVIGY